MILNNKKLLLSLIIVLLPFISEASVYELTYNKHLVTEITGDKPEVKKEDFITTIILAPNKISIKNNSLEMIYDLDKLAITTLDHGNKQYYQNSFYPDVIFRGKEMFNRLGMNVMLATMENKKIALIDNEFAVESLFGVKLRDAIPKDIKEETNGNVHNFIFSDKQVASISLDEKAIKDELKNSFKKFILYNFHLHPDIRNKILNYNKLFSHINYKYQDLNQIITTDISLKSTKEIGDYEIIIPLGYQRTYNEKKKLNAILTRAHSKEGMVSEKQYQAEIDRLITEKKYLDAFLAIHEYMFQYESKPIEQFKKIITSADEKSQVHKLSQSLEPKTKEEIEESIKFINELAKQNLKHGYVLDVFLANIYGSQKSYHIAFSYFDKALEKNPFMTSVYMDYSQLLFEDYETYLAWQLTDAVRDFMPSYSRLELVKQMEKRMRQLNHEFF